MRTTSTSGTPGMTPAMGKDPTKLTEGSLIASERVNGTNVYNPEGEKLGEIEDLMIDKLGGRVAYALLSFGGFLGMGEKLFPLPWSVLTYDREQGGFVINLDKETLKNAPSLDEDRDTAWTAAYGRRVDEYYNTPTLWQ